MIKAEGLSKYFESDGRRLEVLKDIDIEIKAGEFVAVMGKSGSGKSTLISLLSGLDHPSEGRIFLDGQSIETLSEDELTEFRRNLIGFVFQSYNLVPSLTALENVVVPRQLAGDSDPWKKGEELLEVVGLKERMHHQPSQLSGGEQQRVSICRAIANDPKILFADEPTGNLDSTNSQKVLDLLLMMRGERTMVMVTHDPELAGLADRVIEIEDGRILKRHDHGKTRAS